MWGVKRGTGMFGGGGYGSNPKMAPVRKQSGMKPVRFGTQS